MYQNLGLMDKDCEKWSRFMYRLTPEPPKQRFDTLVTQYRLTGDFTYMRFFLHHYERALNSRADAFCLKYAQEHHFEDIKQTIVYAMLAKAPDYDQKSGVSFLQYTKPYVAEALHNFVRLYGSAFSISGYAYKMLRKINAMYYDRFDLSEAERIALITQKTGFPPNEAYAYLVEGESFRYYKRIVANADPDNDDYKEPEDGIDEQTLPDEYSSPDVLVPRYLFYDEIVDAVESLPYKEQYVLLESLGILCLYCGRIGDKANQADLANRFELYSTDTIGKIKDKAIKMVRKTLKDKGWL